MRTAPSGSRGNRTPGPTMTGQRARRERTTPGSNPIVEGATSVTSPAAKARSKVAESRSGRAETPGSLGAVPPTTTSRAPANSERIRRNASRTRSAPEILGSSLASGATTTGTSSGRCISFRASSRE